MPQEAKALGNAWDRLTWGRYTRRHRGRMSPGLMAGVLDVLKTGRKSNSERACARLQGRVTIPGSADDRGSCTEELDESLP
jgi:hypothetical protein